MAVKIKTGAKMIMDIVETIISKMRFILGNL